MKLYEIPEKFAALAAALEEADTDEAAAAIAAQLDALDGEFQAKAAAIARLVKNDRAEADALKTEAERLTKRRQSAERRAQYWESYLLSQMQALALPAVADPAGVLNLKRVLNPVRVDIACEPHELPPDLVQEEWTVKPDRKLIKAAIESGRDVPGCALVRTERLKIG